MKKTLVIMSALTAMTISNPAAAQGESETIGTSAYPISRGGVQEGCAIEFTHIATDLSYKGGAPVLLNGSFGPRIINGNLVLTFKLMMDDVVTGPDGQKTLKPSKPASVALYAANGKSNVKTQISAVDGEKPGSILTLYPFDEINGEVLGMIPGKHQLSISYNRAEGGQDVRFNVDLDVPRKPGNETVSDFMKCMRGMADQEAG